MSDARRETRRKEDVREVYFVRATTLGHIKIGVANNAWLRFMALDSSSPDPLELLGVIRSPEAVKLESSIHHRFADDRIRREWFRASPELLAYVAAHAKDRIDAFNAEMRARCAARLTSKSGRKPGWRERQLARKEPLTSQQGDTQ